LYLKIYQVECCSGVYRRWISDYDNNKSKVINEYL